MSPQPDLAAFLVRVWHEQGEFRARVSYFVDPTTGSRAFVQVTTTDQDEVQRRLAMWLQAANHGGP